MENDGIIRMLVNQECIYNCFFCHKEGIERKCKEELTPKDISFLFWIFNKNFNKNSIRLSGGEPLLRKDIIEIAKELKKANAKIFMTTNAALLSEKIEICQYLEKINISIHSLKKEMYKNITGTDIDVNNILETIKNIRKIFPQLVITLDITLLKGMNSSKEEIEDYIKFGEDNNVYIKFIELFKSKKELLYYVELIENILKEKEYEKRTEYIRKTEYIKNDNKVILSKCFCASNENNIELGNECKNHNDLFISSDGKISVCRLNAYEIDILKEIKQRTEKELVNKINEAYSKLGNHCLEGK